MGKGICFLVGNGKDCLELQRGQVGRNKKKRNNYRNNRYTSVKKTLNNKYCNQR